MLKITYFNVSAEKIEICSEYWELNNNGEFLHQVSAIGEKYGLSSYEVVQIAKEDCQAFSCVYSCANCNSPYQYESRKDYLSKIKYWKNNWICRNCLSKKQLDIEKKEKAIKEQKIADQEKIENILSNKFIYQQDNVPLSIDTLDIRSAVLLLSLIRYSANEELTYINEFSVNSVDRFSPDSDDDLDFLMELYNKGYIAIAPFSNPAALILESDGKLSFYPKSVKWLLPFQKEQSFNEIVSRLEIKLSSKGCFSDYTEIGSYDSVKFEQGYNEALEFCKDISLRECLAYLKYTMSKYSLHFVPGEKTKLVLIKVLENYSVSQAYSLIWSAVSNTAAFYMRTPGVNKSQAANSVVGAIERNFERAYAENWTVKSYKRNFDLPQSMISRVVFNVIFDINDGFSHKQGCYYNLPDIGD